MRKMLFVLAALVVLFTASSAKAEVMEYLGTSLDVSPTIALWGQRIDDSAWLQVCLKEGKQVDESHIDIVFDNDIKKCSEGSVAFYHDFLNTDGTAVGHLIDIPVEVPDAEKKGCEVGKEKECPQFEHYRWWSVSSMFIEMAIDANLIQQATATVPSASEIVVLTPVPNPPAPAVVAPPAPKVAVTPPPPVTLPPPGAQLAVSSAPILIFISGEINACFSFTETTTNNLGIETGQKPVTRKECGIIASLFGEDGRFIASVAAGKKTFEGVPLCELKDITFARAESAVKFKELMSKQCK